MDLVFGGGGERLYSQNLRHFLSIKEEDHLRNLNQSTPSSSGVGRRSSSGLTLSAVLGDKIGQPPPVEEPLRRVESNRTLLDIIREDQITGLGRGQEDSRGNWPELKDRFRLRLLRPRRKHGSASWRVDRTTRPSDVNNNNHHHQTITATDNHSFRFFSSTHSGESSQPASRAPIPSRNSRQLTESASGRLNQTQLSSPPRRRSTTDDNRRDENLIEQRRSDTAEAATGGSASPEQPVRMSLMALLAENDRQMGYDSSAYVMDEDMMDVDDETEGIVAEETGTSVPAAAGGSKGTEAENCCICMVRHKGAAFIPCGHTFCRLCSRELWVQRGNCPLCNNFILEVLDIF